MGKALVGLLSAAILYGSALAENDYHLKCSNAPGIEGGAYVFPPAKSHVIVVVLKRTS